MERKEREREREFSGRRKLSLMGRGEGPASQFAERFADLDSSKGCIMIALTAFLTVFSFFDKYGCNWLYGHMMHTGS